MKSKITLLDKYLSIFLYINVLQIIVIIILFGADKVVFEGIPSTESYKFKIIIVVLGILALINFVSLYNTLKSLRREQLRTSIQEKSLSQIKELNNTLRAQRHDFLNNLQVVYSLIQLDEYTDAKEYIEDVYKDIKKVSKVLRTKDTAINALLQAKILDSESKSICTKLDISSTLNNLRAPSWEMCRVLGNLIDNAIFELAKIPEEKTLIISIGEELNYHIFNVKNNGNPIPKELLDKIFEANFSTKGEKGEGMGLAITKEIIESNNGTIKVESDDKWTSFEVKIPINL